jgi:outer membrane protein OmpA-like peptidoglycan-associated protein
MRSTITFARRTCPFLHRIITVAVLIGVTSTIALAQTSCESLVPAFNAAWSRRDFQAIVATAKQIIDVPDVCPAKTRADIKRQTALAHLAESRQISETADAARLQMLEAGSVFDKPWQLMERIGDLKQKVPNSSGQIDYKAASTSYQLALADISDNVRVPNPPPPERIERLLRLAQQTRALSAGFVAGDVLVTRALRGVAVDGVPVPVQFIRDRDEMTDLGRQYAEETSKLLTEQGRPKILLVGHTDPDGSDQYNLELSRRRAQAVKQYLVGQGYPNAAIDVEGKGRGQPLRIENAAEYTQAQIYQMLRRVEVKFR